jgi:hypothetical protein
VSYGLPILLRVSRIHLREIEKRRTSSGPVTNSALSVAPQIQTKEQASRKRKLIGLDLNAFGVEKSVPVLMKVAHFVIRQLRPPY